MGHQVNGKGRAHAAWRRVRRLATLAAGVAMLPVAASAGPVMALTFDDIPAHGPLPPGVSRVQVIDAIVAALRAARAPAQGFLNAGFGKPDPDSSTAVAHWRAAGLPLGNHGYSHLALSKVGSAAFLADAVADEPALMAAMGGADWHWFRFPFLDEGATPDQVATVRAGLRARGYRIAAVTLSFGDYAWNEPYARCTAKGDAAAVASLEDGYIRAAEDDASRHRALSRTLYGRDIPYVLLMHVGAFDAHMLPRLLARYRALGFRFITLDRAERHPFYAAATDLSRPGPTANLDSAAVARGVAVPSPAMPLPSAAFCS